MPLFDARAPVHVRTHDEPVFPPDPQLVSLTAWGALLVALPLALWLTVRIHDKFDARSWPRASAEIVSSKLYKQSGKSGSRWCISLAYRYQVDGRTYLSRRSSTSIMSDVACDPSPDVMQARFEKQQPGDRLTIRHHPRDHARATAYLDRLDVIDFLFSALAIVLFVGGLRLRRESGRLRLEQAAQAALRRERIQGASDAAQRQRG